MPLMKDSLAMTRAREVNRANGRRLSDSMIDMSQSMQLRMLEIKKENEMAKAFLMKIRASSGSSESSVRPNTREDIEIDKILKPPPKMNFGKTDYKNRMGAATLRLSAPMLSSACDGNPVPLRVVHPWMRSTTRVLQRKKPPTVAHPTGRRRHSMVAMDSDDEDEDRKQMKKIKAKLKKKK